MYLNPLFGEIWYVKFQQDSICSEIDAITAIDAKNSRPAVVLSYTQEDKIKNRTETSGRDLTDIRFVVPFTGWKSYHDGLPFFVPVRKSSTNNLTKPSSALIMQSRCCDLSRFERRIGNLNKTEIQMIIERIKICIGDSYNLCE
jgi:mRNA-degrading endonuclease toxin of MazEF toxin-antitoxin module